MNGLITNPFVEGVILLVVGLGFAIAGHLMNASDLSSIASMIMGGGLMSLGLATKNTGMK